MRYVAKAGLRRALLASVFAASIAFASGAAEYKVERLVPGSPFHGVHGVYFDKAGSLYAGSVVGQALYKVNPKSGEVSTYIGPPEGMADDLVFGPDGTLYWTSFLAGILHAKKGDGPIMELAKGLPGINAISFRKSDGKLFATQVFLGDALYEIDPTGAKPPRKIMEKMGGLNGFDIGSDGMIYGPLWFKGQIVRVDPDKAELKVVADGFKIPAAAKFDSKGDLYVDDTATGELVKVDVKTGKKTVVAKLETALDNLAVDASDHVYVSNMADNGIQEVDPATGKVRQVVKGELSMPGGVALVADGDKETLYIADLFAYRSVDAKTGAVTDIARMQADHLEYPFSVTATPAHVTLSSWFTGTVQTFDRKSGQSLVMRHGFKAPQDALELPDGSVVVAELGTGSLVKASGEEGKDRQVVAKDLKGPVGLAWAGSDAVYVTEAPAGEIARIDLKNGEKKTVASGLQMPKGIAVAPDGKLVVVEAGAKQVVAIDPASGQKTVLAGNLPLGLRPAPGAPPSMIPTGVAVSKTGVVYVTSDLENSLLKLTPQ